MDIYNIPIARITDDFLGYISRMQEMNIELASEFILVAATLMRIKARLLLPRKELDEEGNEIDPRDELVQRLIEYKRFKEASEELSEMEVERLKKYARGNIDKQMKEVSEMYSAEAELHSLTVYRLYSAFNRVMNRFHDRNVEVKHTVQRYHYTLEDERKLLLKKVKGKEKIEFEEVFKHCENKVHAIFTFLGMLELVQQKKLNLRIGEGMNNFWISGV